jgi:hypothetical protein
MKAGIDLEDLIRIIEDEESGTIKKDILQAIFRSIEKRQNEFEEDIKQVNTSLRTVMENSTKILQILEGYNGSGILARLQKAEKDINTIGSQKYHALEELFEKKIMTMEKEKIEPLEKKMYMAMGAIALLTFIMPYIWKLILK